MFRGSANRRKLPEFLTFDQMETLLDWFDLDDPAQIRDRCMIEVMYACGLRVSECAGLRLEKINLKEHYLSVIGKESKERMVPFYPRCAQLIELYLTEAVPVFMADRMNMAICLSTGEASRLLPVRSRESRKKQLRQPVCRAVCIRIC